MEKFINRDFETIIPILYLSSYRCHADRPTDRPGIICPIFPKNPDKAHYLRPVLERPILARASSKMMMIPGCPSLNLGHSGPRSAASHVSARFTVTVEFPRRAQALPETRQL